MNILLLGFLLPIASWMVACYLQRYLWYNFKNNNCWDMSIAQKKIFKCLGFDVEIWEGDFAKSRSARSHAWLRIGRGKHKIAWEPMWLMPFLNPARGLKLLNVRRVTGKQEVR